MLSRLYEVVVKGNQKAVVAFALTFVGGLGLTVHGVNILDATVGDVISTTMNSVIASFGVWLTANKK